MPQNSRENAAKSKNFVQKAAKVWSVGLIKLRAKASRVQGLSARTTNTKVKKSKRKTEMDLYRDVEELLSVYTSIFRCEWINQRIAQVETELYLSGSDSNYCSL